MEFIPALQPASQSLPAYWLSFLGDKLLITKDGGQVSIPLADDLTALGLKPLRSQYLGSLDGYPCYCTELTQDTAVPQGMEFLGLRQLFGRGDETLYSLAGRARQIVAWDKTHQYCGQCGSPTQNKVDERAKLCPRCGEVTYPVLSPAIIVAITKGDELLLARGNRFAVPMYSVLAGFVEPGESLEECVHREVREEVGIEVKHISYFGSQPWPFPHSLMIGFTAEYAGGEIHIDPREIVDAGWYRAENLPLIPDKLSIARRLIDWFIETKG